MKKVIALLMAMVLLFALAGCSDTGNGTVESKTDVKETAAVTEAVQTDETAVSDDGEAEKTNALVVYFSRTGEQYGVGVIDKGNTAIVADMIVEETGADVFEIIPKEDNYPMTYKELTDYAKEEQNNNARPEILDTVENFDAYDTVYLGYPIWWGDLPMICYTFLESYDFTGKTVIPFCTHAGSGNAGTQSKIQTAIPNAEVKEVLAIAGTDTQNDPDSVKSTVTEWLDEMK
ncbi:MAG: flavodoxin [Ruminococcus sp.]|nr:flavodoxin [Ruminococcus sp.]